MPVLSVQSMMRALAVIGFWLGLLTIARADGLADNDPGKVRRIPQLGIEISAEQRQALQAGLDRLATAIADLEKKPDARLPISALLPDIRIYWQAVHNA